MDGDRGTGMGFSGSAEKKCAGGCDGGSRIRGEDGRGSGLNG